MTARFWLAGAMAFGLGAQAAPAMAEVALLKDDFFVIRHTQTVKADADAVWDDILSPADWWSGEHSFSGDAENFILDARAGGCFCEMLPVGEGRSEPGSVRHLEVIFVDPGKALRLTGALGPLQSEPLSGVLTITLKAVDDGTRILFEYAVGGPSRFEQGTIAPAVDGVIGEQLSRLSALIEGAAPLAPDNGSEVDPVPDAVDEEVREPVAKPQFGAETRAVPVIVATEESGGALEKPLANAEQADEGKQEEVGEEEGIGADFLSGT